MVLPKTQAIPPPLNRCQAVLQLYYQKVIEIFLMKQIFLVESEALLELSISVGACLFQ